MEMLTKQTLEQTAQTLFLGKLLLLAVEQEVRQILLEQVVARLQAGQGAVGGIRKAQVQRGRLTKDMVAALLERPLLTAQVAAVQAVLEATITVALALSAVLVFRLQLTAQQPSVRVAVLHLIIKLITDILAVMAVEASDVMQ